MVFQRLFKQSSVEEVSVDEAKEKQQAGAVVVDVRELNEWRAGYIPGAKLILLGSLASRMRELDPTKEIIAVCRSGNRSKSAALILQRAGFTRVSSMAGGMISWLRQHFPVSSQLNDAGSAINYDGHAVHDHLCRIERSIYQWDAELPSYDRCV